MEGRPKTPSMVSTILPIIRRQSIGDLMSRTSLTLVFVMDPVELEPLDGSTTIVMMKEAQDRGHVVLYVDPAAL